MRICYRCGKRNEDGCRVCTACRRPLAGNCLVVPADGSLTAHDAAVKLSRRFGRPLPSGYFWTYLLPIVFCLWTGVSQLSLTAGTPGEVLSALLWGAAGLVLGVLMTVDMILALVRIRRADRLHASLRRGDDGAGADALSAAVRRLVRIERSDTSPLFLWMLLPTAYLCACCVSAISGSSGGAGPSGGKLIGFMLGLLSVAVLVFLAVCRVVQLVMICKRRRAAAETPDEAAASPASPAARPAAHTARPAAPRPANYMVCRPHERTVSAPLVTMRSSDGTGTAAALRSVCAALTAGASAHGFEPSEGCAREIVAAMSAARVILAVDASAAEASAVIPDAPTALASTLGDAFRVLPSDGPDVPADREDCAVVSLTGRPVQPADAPAAPSLPDAAALSRLSESARACFFLPEETWRRLDELDAFLSARTGRGFDNRLTRRAETFSSVILAAGARPEDALDAALSAVLLPPLIAASPADALRPCEDHPGLVDCLDRLFGLDSLPRTLRALGRAGLTDR